MTVSTGPRTTTAERLDRAVDALLTGASPAGAATAVRDPSLRPLVELADRLRGALRAPPVSTRFEARLGARLAESSIFERSTRALQHPGRRLVVGAALSSAAVGMGVTAFAVWRSSRRHTGAHRALR